MPDFSTRYQFTRPIVSGDSGLWGGYLRTDIDLDDKLHGLPKPVRAAQATGAMNLATALHWTLSPAGPITLSFTNVPTKETGGSDIATLVLVKIVNGSTNITWPTGTVWVAGGAAPTLQTTGTDWVLFWILDEAATVVQAVHLGGAPQDGTVTTAKIAAGAVTTAKLDATGGSEAVNTAQIRARAATIAKLATFVCVAKRSTAQVVGSGASDPIAFNDTDIYDPQAMHDPAVNNSRITIPTAGDGFYRFTVVLTIDSAAGTNMTQFIVRKNGTTEIGGVREWIVNGDGSVHLVFEAFDAAVATNYYEVVVSPTSMSVNIHADQHIATFTAELIGA